MSHPTAEKCACPDTDAARCYVTRIDDGDEDGCCTCTCHRLDKHDAGSAALWLEERAKANREVAALPREQWPYHPDVQTHFALRFEQIAELLRAQRNEIHQLRRDRDQHAGNATAVLQAQHERDAAIEDVARLRAIMRNTAGWLNNGCEPARAAAELLLVAGLPADVGGERG